MRISPSSAAFALGNLVVTDYSQGCLRHLLFKRKIPKDSDIPEEFAKMGEDGELKYLDYMLTQQDYPFHRELPFISEIDGVPVKGRVDFVSYHDGFRVIHECKTSQSKTFLYGVVRKGEPKLNHVAQIVSYLVHFGETKAKLVARYAPKNEERIIKIEVDDLGRILVDKRVYKYSLQEQINHQLLSAKVIKENLIWDRPSTGTCRYCQYAEECLKWDTEEFKSTEYFFNQMKEKSEW